VTRLVRSGCLFLSVSAVGSPTAASRGGGGRLPTDCVAAPFLICWRTRATTLAAAIPMVTQVSAGSLPHLPAPSSTAPTSVAASSMAHTLAMEESDVSETQVTASESKPMSSAAEMTTLLKVVAAPAEPGESVKAVIGRASRRLGWSWGRTKRLYYGEARRIDAEEMDLARAKARERSQKLATDRAVAREAADEFRQMGERIARVEALLEAANAPRSVADAGIASGRGDGGPMASRGR
jgi:hypothetical protein